MGRPLKYKIKGKKFEKLKDRQWSVSDEFEITDNGQVVRNDFTASVENLSAEDIGVSAKKKKKSGGAIARKIILIICTAVFIGCGIYLVWNLTNQKSGNDMYKGEGEDFLNVFSDDEDDAGAVSKLKPFMSANRILCLKDRLAAKENPGELGGYNSGSTFEEIRAKLIADKERWPDLYGWIYAEGTTINYPIMQSNDNEFYLNNSPYGRPLINGSIFADYRNDKNILMNFNTVMYGHNLMGGGMFHDVEAHFYADEEKFKNTYIYIYTLDGEYVYEPFAVFATSADHQYFRTEFASASEFVDFAYGLQSFSRYQKNMKFVPTDRIITLSTCTNNLEGDGRYALHAKLVKVSN